MRSLNEPIKLIDLFPTIRENNELQSLMDTLKIFQPVTKALQKENMDLSLTRTLFDNVIEKVPGLDSNRKYLNENSSIVKYPSFESGVVKILDNKIEQMNDDEKTACEILKSDNNVLEISSDGDSDYASSVLKRKRARLFPTNSYIKCDFLEPTSNRVERFFSSAGFAYSKYRQNLSPVHLEEQMFLKFNKPYWNRKLVENAMNSIEI